MIFRVFYEIHMRYFFCVNCQFRCLKVYIMYLKLQAELILYFSMSSIFFINGFN